MRCNNGIEVIAGIAVNMTSGLTLNAVLTLQAIDSNKVSTIFLILEIVILFYFVSIDSIDFNKYDIN